MSLSDEVIYLEFEPLWKGLKPIYKEEKIKEAIKELISKGEVLKNGAFVINYKEMLEIFGGKLI